MQDKPWNHMAVEASIAIAWPKGGPSGRCRIVIAAGQRQAAFGTQQAAELKWAGAGTASQASTPLA
jgi:hypothetical protein